MSHKLLLMLTCQILFLMTAQIAALPPAPNSPEHDARIKPLSESPQNEAVTAGGTVILRCAVIDPPPASRVLWSELTTATGGMAISDGENILPTHPNRDRYRIIHESSTEFHLEIRDVRLTDGGQYICQDIDATASYRSSAQLVVLASAPVCTTTVRADGVVMEDQNHYTECVLSYQGNIQPTMTWTGPPPFEVTYSPPDPSRIWTRIAYAVHRDLNAERFQCRSNFTVLGDQPGDVATNVPTWENLYLSPQHFVYWVPKNVHIVPEKNEYEVGNAITCWSDANPAAFYQWVNLRTLEVFNNQVFTVTEDLRGLVTPMTCLTQNIIEGSIYQDSLIVYINVP